jgi:hypothetical protein
MTRATSYQARGPRGIAVENSPPAAAGGAFLDGPCDRELRTQRRSLAVLWHSRPLGGGVGARTSWRQASQEKCQKLDIRP